MNYFFLSYFLSNLVSFPRSTDFQRWGIQSSVFFLFTFSSPHGFPTSPHQKPRVAELFPFLTDHTLFFGNAFQLYQPPETQDWVFLATCWAYWGFFGVKNKRKKTLGPKQTLSFAYLDKIIYCGSVTFIWLSTSLLFLFPTLNLILNYILILVLLLRRELT